MFVLLFAFLCFIMNHSDGVGKFNKTRERCTFILNVLNLPQLSVEVDLV